MHEDEGRDIPPDEDRLNYTPPPPRSEESLPSDDLHEDTAHHSNHSNLLNGIQSRGGYRVHEPMDATPDAVGSIDRRVFPSSPRRQATNTPNFYKSEENRLSTFNDWRHQSIIRKEDLAKDGFVYTGSGDKVRCVFCNGILRQWEEGDVVREEHQRNYPQCPYCLGQDVGNIPFNPPNGYHPSSNFHAPSSLLARPGQGHDIDPIEDRCGGGAQRSYVNGHHVSDAVSGMNNSTGDDEMSGKRYSTAPCNPRMKVEPERLATFDTWPAQMKQKPKELAQAGLYYTGDGDKVKCFHCDVLLYNWEPEDDPFVEHARWFPDCPYIRLVKGDDFVHNVKNGTISHNHEMEKPAVLAVLSEGYSVHIVKKAIGEIKSKEGSDAVITAGKLLTKVLEMEDAEKGVNKHVNGFAESSEDVEKLRMENESLKEKQQCKICMDNEVEVIFYPCKHFVCCASCGAAVRECPICRVKVQSMDKVYMS